MKNTKNEQRRPLIGTKEFTDLADVFFGGKSKKETLEEVAHKMLNDYGIKSMGQSIGVLEVKKLMVKMAKWQQERIGLMEIELRHTKTLLASCEKALEDRDKQDKNKYSEEIIDILDNVRYWETCPNKYKVIIQEWFEQFIKK